MLEHLSIITITFNNPSELKKTYNSLSEFRKNRGTHIIINGGQSVRSIIKHDCKLIEEQDNGIYDAINKGIKLVNTPYYMLIHSGDYLIVNCDFLKNQLSIIKENRLCLLLNDCTIGLGKAQRLMSAKYWKPWMFKLGAQPPHPPIIYDTKLTIQHKYNLEHSVIADFDFLENLFKEKPRFAKGNIALINMSRGGKTSNGLKSFVLVSREFAKLKGKKRALFFLFTRPIIKIIQMI